MKKLFAIKDPIKRKRWLRFRRRKRAFYSLILLVALYLISLGSELICNEKPLLMRFKGRFYMPVVRFYPDDAFTASGIQTRPDYRELADSEVFKNEVDNWMLFAPVPFGPNTVLDPDDLQDEIHVSIQMMPIPKVGSVDLDKAGVIVRSRSAEDFFDGGRPESFSIHDVWEIPSVIRDGLELRFKNQNAARIQAEAIHSKSGKRAEITLSTFRARKRAPDRVRLVFRESAAGTAALDVLVAKDGEITSNGALRWNELDVAVQEELRHLALAAYERPVTRDPIQIQGHLYDVLIEKQDVAWPHPPVRGHWLGIDSAGRDVFARILYGLRISVTFGLVLVGVSMLLGVLAGAVQGYFAGWVDMTAQRGIEIWSALPFLYIMILMGSIFGSSFGLLLIVYALFNWIGISYYIRGEFLRLRHAPFVEAARCMGLGSGKIILRHVLPNAMTPVVTFFPFSLIGAIGALYSLDYLGFGLPPPTPSWGELLHQAQTFRWAWWLILYPSLALFAVMIMGVFIGEGVRDAYDPRPVARME